GRFRQRAIETPAGAYWEADGSFELHRHVVPVALPPPAGTAELRALVSQLVSTPLDAEHPMWQFQLVEDYDGGSAIVVRIHHCYAAGIALVRVMLSMTDSAPHGAPAMPFEPREKNRASAGDDAFLSWAGPLAGAVDGARKFAGTLLEKGAAIWNDPAQ